MATDIINQIDFDKLSWPIYVRNWNDSDINQLIELCTDPGFLSLLGLHGSTVFIYNRTHQIIHLENKFNKKYKSWRCFIGHWWNRTGTNKMASRSMNTCMRCGSYKAGPE